MRTTLSGIHFALRTADPGLSGQDILSVAEHTRLASMHEGARPAYVTARAMLRRRLAAFMGVTPNTVPLTQVGAGRIAIDGFRDDEPPFFSVSHTGAAEAGIAGVAVCAEAPIGIDVQQIDPNLNWQRIAERRYPADELATLMAMPEDAARMLFFTLWSIKEAFVKLENGTLMPYLRGIQLAFSNGTFSLAAPTPAGLESASIFVSSEPDHNIVLACVCPNALPVHMDIDLQVFANAPSALENRPGD